MGLVTGAVGSLLPKLGELLKEEYGLQKGVKKKVQTLSRELEAAHAVLREISGVPPDQLNELVKLWARDVREASYDMEDIVDAFLVRIDAPEPAETHKLRRLKKKVSSLFKKSKARRDISSQIKEIYNKLEELAARHDRYKTVDSIVTKPALTIDPRIMNLYRSATELVGIDGPKQELIDMLSLGDDGGGGPDNKKIKVVSVVGVGGLGKTTLAKAVYDQLKLHFECRAFVPVGQNPDIKKVFRDILIALDENTYTYYKLKGLDENQLMDKLIEFIKKKRFFIVIDDIWDKETWKLVICALQQNNRGSRLVVTSRISEVAAYTGEAYKIQPLSHDNSEKLLYARIVDGEGKYFDRPSSEACERILKKCGGVPLAIITIASLLASKPLEDWSEVYNSIGFGHKGNDVVDNTIRILSFSYYDLPSHLKACLLCLSVFPEDYSIEKNSLLWKWIAEGVISEEQAAAVGLGIFEFGETCFNELINRNMIQPEYIEYQGFVDGCSVHDMVLYLIQRISREENFVTILNGGERQKLEGSISRRLALQYCDKEHKVGHLTNMAVEKVRSIIVGECDFCALSQRLPLLRVAEVEECSVFDEECSVLDEDCSEDVLNLRSLPHLRYLKLGTSRITRLPKEVKYLRFLQTLDLDGDYSDVKELPEEVGLLTQLVCLQAANTRVPAGLIGKLISLQQLSMRCKGEDATMQFVKELGLLRELRVLWAEIDVTSESLQRCLLESLENLHNIKELRILGSSITLSKEDKNNAAGLVSCRHLRFLLLHCLMFSGLSAWIKSSLTPNLTYLQVKLADVNDQDMETLAKLPELSFIQLYLESSTKLVVSIKIPTGEGVGYFRKLRFLTIYGASIWFDLRASECNNNTTAPSNTIMPSLESLEFDVHVRSLKDHNLQLGFDKMLGFQNLGTSSLEIVTVNMNCESAYPREVEEAEAALKHAVTVHPKHPTLDCTRIHEQRNNSLMEMGDRERRSEAPPWATSEVLDPTVSHQRGSSATTVAPLPASSSVSRRFDEALLKIKKAPELVIKAWKSVETIGSEHIQILRLPDPTTSSSSKVICLLNTKMGEALLALCSDAIHKLWKWQHSDNNLCGKHVFWQPPNGILMTNDTTDGIDSEEATHCAAISKHGSYLISTSGGKVLLFSMTTFKVMTYLMAPAPPPAATFLAFYPLDNNIIAIGMEDSSVQIYILRTGEVQIVLTGHHKKITGLAFSSSMKVLVSSGADAQLCVWSTDGWEKKKSIYIKHPSNGSDALVGDTTVQFHFDGTLLLVVHESQLAIYDCQLQCLCLWFPSNALPAPISSAVYSLGSLLVYAGFRDGTIGIFKAESLTLRCRIAPSAYIPSLISSGEIVYPTVVAADPWKLNQIAVGMSDGAVYVIEPLDTDEGQVGSDTSSEQRPPTSASSSSGDGQPSV